MAVGRMVWCDLMTNDTGKAKDFYTKLMGWTITPFDMGGGEKYEMWTNGDAPLGGLMKNPQAGVPPHWIMYVAVANVDQAHAKAKKLGSQEYVPPTDIPTVGRFSVIADPQGAVLALYTPAPGSPEMPDTKPGVGQISWYELATENLDAARKFYTDMFGWEMRAAHDMGEMGPYQIFGRKGVAHDTGGMFKRPKEMPVSAWMLYASVPDINKAAADVKKLGGQVINGPMEVPGGDHILNLIDSTGAMFALHQAAPA